MTSLTAECCISGGGPAGLMLGYLLARRGIDVIVLEKHADFLRDFRGDTVHPSTLELFYELGLLDGLLERRHQTTDRVSMMISGDRLQIADFRRLSTRCKFIAMMPQWDFLDYLADEARAYPNFRLLMSTESRSLIEENGSVAGLRAVSEEGEIEIRSSLVVAADGRASQLRDLSGLEVQDFGAPIDVFWMRLARKPDDSTESIAHISSSGFLVLINRNDYWQCAMPIRKGHAEEIRAQGIGEFRSRITRIAPSLADATQGLRDWDDVKLLTVQVNRLKTWWREGLLFIGDAAHAMSPIGGVGINLAIQDAVAAGRILGPALRAGNVTTDLLASIQKRREWPTRATQRAQIFAQDRILVPVLGADEEIRAPFFLRLLNAVPALRGLPARAIGLGVRPEHWHGEDGAEY